MAGEYELQAYYTSLRKWRGVAGATSKADARRQFAKMRRVFANTHIWRVRYRTFNPWKVVRL